MRTTLMLSLATLALVAAGCGQAQESPPRAEPARLAGCSVAKSSDSIHSARPLRVSADLDGHGQADQLEVTKAGSPCPGVLFTRIAGTVFSVKLPDGQAPTGPATKVVVHGRTGDLVVLRQVHPRGGFQVRLFGFADNKLGEVTAGGNPVVPFVATDTRGGYVSVSCTDDGLTVQEAVAHTPPGIVFAWDIRQTSYTITGNEAAARGTREIADNVLDERLGSRFPAVQQRQMFQQGCA